MTRLELFIGAQQQNTGGLYQELSQNGYPNSIQNHLNELRKNESFKTSVTSAYGKSDTIDLATVKITYSHDGAFYVTSPTQGTKRIYAADINNGFHDHWQNIHDIVEKALKGPSTSTSTSSTTPRTSQLTSSLPTSDSSTTKKNNETQTTTNAKIGTDNDYDSIPPLVVDSRSITTRSVSTETESFQSAMNSSDEPTFSQNNMPFLATTPPTSPTSSSSMHLNLEALAGSSTSLNGDDDSLLLRLSDNHTRNVQDLTETIAQQNSMIQALLARENRFSSLEQERNVLSEELSKLKKQKQKLSTFHNTLITEQNELLKQLEEEKEFLQNRLDLLHKKLVQQSVYFLEQEKMQEETIQALQTTNDTYTTAIQQQLYTINTLQNNLNEMKQELESIRQALGDDKTSLGNEINLEEKIQELKQKAELVTALGNAIKKQKEKLISQQDQIEGVNFEKTQLKELNKKLQQELERVRNFLKTITGKVAQVENLSKKIIEKDTEINKQKEQINQLQKNLSEKEDEIAAIQKEMTLLKENNINLKNQ